MTGLVGAAGGLGRFFPPLVLGAIRQATGSFTWGSCSWPFSLGCLLVCRVANAPSSLGASRAA